MITCLAPGEASIVAAHQPALVLEYAASRDLAVPALWRGTGLDGPEPPPADLLLAPPQYLQLLQNAARLLDSPDTSFMLGQQMLPGEYGPASGALQHAGSLREALGLLEDWQPVLSPLLRPRLNVEGGLAALYWTDCHGAPGALSLLAEMHMTAVAAMCRWLGGERLPWRFCFNRTRPRHTEQHEVHLGPELRFDCHLDAMLIDAAWLDRPWPGASAEVVAANVRAARALPPRLPSLPTALYDYLLARVGGAPTLERAAADFGVSPATFKRHLARHHTHFQAELDQVRTHVALYLFQTRGADNEAVARHLGFHDAANFRRSFKRWTGVTPGLLRDSLLAAPA
ncbi:AraC family transcriptional regulator [Pseudoduganella namucuonensis]|uniref:Transcriptional regulator, AraC family n=1 Tax=Pseudoduganella namucuonensis TaxID=1035707 RepID=A0A1I7M270_9BURK|nr:AraC family transcriptional regulator [Pseudoduganella namucuonensis]SFV16043.1 transcriptional regulator, AraC family [Pseudoduganella namucuonensis]